MQAMLASLALGLIAASDSLGGQDTVLGTYQIAGQPVQATLPTSVAEIPEEAPYVEWQGSRYLVDPTGAIVRRYKAGGGWPEIKALYEEAKAQPDSRPWHVKVVIFTDSDVYEQAPGAPLRLRRPSMHKAMLAEVYQSLARFASAAEGYSLGHLKVDFEAKVEESVMRFELGAPGGAFSAEFGRSYFAPRINTGEYEPDDRSYLGPYGSVFFLHPDREAPARMVEVNGSPVTGISTFGSDPYDAAPDSLADRLIDAWVDHVAFRARERGYALSADLGLATLKGFTPRMWRVISGAEATTPDQYLDRLDPEGSASTWAEARDDPLDRLPHLQSEQGSSDPQALSVPLEFADLMGSRLDRSYDPRVVGWFENGGQVRVRFRLAKAADGFLLDREGVAGTIPAAFSTRWIALSTRRLVAGGTSGALRLLGNVKEPDKLEWQLPAGWTLKSVKADSTGLIAALVWPTGAVGEVRVRLKGQEAWLTADVTAGSDEAARNDMSEASAVNLSTAGLFSAHIETDPERGQVLAVREHFGPRGGRVLLLGTATGEPIANPGDRPFLELWVKASNPQPVSLTVHGAEGSSSRIGLFGALPGLSWTSPSTWRRVIVDLRELGVPDQIIAVTLDTPPEAHRSDQRIGSALYIDDVRLTREAACPTQALTGPHVPSALATSSFEADRELFATTASESQVSDLIRLFKDDDPLVRLNAVQAFTHIKSTAALPGLEELALQPGYTPVSERAVVALAHQDTPEGWQAVRKALTSISEPVHLQAARALYGRGDATLAGPLARLIASRWWPNQAAAARAIGSLPGEDAASVLLAFSNLGDPAVRLEFVQAAALKWKHLAERVLWMSVNDEMDLIRGVAYDRLIAEGGVLQQEGLKGTRDESSATRIHVLDSIGLSRLSAGRSAVLGALKDPEPLVRAAALRALGSLAAPATVQELENVSTDKDPRVQLALLTAVKAKGLKLSNEALRTLRNSVSKEVRRQLLEIDK